jgi:hypothetical protein
LFNFRFKHNPVTNNKEKAKAGEEGRSLEEELPINERIIKFSNSLDKNDDSLWNINGSPKIKNFKEHFGDEFNRFHLLHFCFLQQQGVTE